jgi:N-succinyldiaminopimelate aminotransferase
MARAALAQLGTSIFSEMTALAVRYGAINLSQGFPDFDGPQEIVDHAVAALRAGHNQYARSAGIPALAQAVAAHQLSHYGIELDPLTQVVCTAGATEAIAAAMLGLLEPGDEVILVAPHYDAYPAAVMMAGARVRVVEMTFPAFRLPIAAIAAAVTPRTKAVVLTNPHNPTGRVFDHEELSSLAALCVKHDLLAFSDEVYEHLTFDDARHLPLTTLPGMAERTVTFSSSGKTFSFTGWKVGWASGPPSHMAGVQAAHQFLTFCGATPLHAAMATTLRQCAASYFTDLKRDYVERRDHLVTTLRSVGMTVTVPAGAYFVVADIGDHRPDDDDRSFARWLTAEGVAAIPLSAFHPDGLGPKRLLRFAFCKRMATLEEARLRLQRILGAS